MWVEQGRTNSPRTSLLASVLVACALCALLAMFAFGTAVAHADAGQGVGKTEFSCTHVRFSFEGFPNAENNTVTEVVQINKEVVATYTLVFNGPTGANTVAIPEVKGKAIVDAHATWKTNGISGGFDHHVNLKCQDGFSIQKLQEIKGSATGYTTSELQGKIGQTVDYEVIVTNVGSVPLKFSNFTDSHCEPGTISGGSGEAFLAPGESTTYTCERLLTAIGTYENEATVTGTPEVGPGGSETSNNVVTVVPVEAEFTIHKLQQVNGAGGFTTEVLQAGAGAEVEYEIIVTNTGNVPLTFKEFSDPKCDAGTIAGGPGATPLAPGESSTYTCDHVMTVKNTKQGPYRNTAKVKADPPAGEDKAHPSGVPATITHESNTVEVTILGGSAENEFKCEGVTFLFSGFPNAEGNTVNEEVTYKMAKGAHPRSSRTCSSSTGRPG